MKSYLTFNSNNKHISSRNITLLYDFFTQFNISESLKNSILQRVNAEINFELSVSELQQLQLAASEKIDELIIDANFDPFKERLRRIYPNYSGNPFIWKEVTYYLYVKTNPIDSQISTVKSFLAHINEFINQNEPMRYIFKN
jgi:hypothetical protein